MRSHLNSVRRARPLLGTFVEIEIGGLGEEKEAHRTADAAFSAIADVQHRMSFHDARSTLSRLNREAARRAVRVDASTFEVLQTAAELNRASGGVFDVTIGRRMQALGFLPRVEQRERSHRNSCEPNFANVELLPDQRVRFHHPGIQIDLGGIAKGYAVDRAIAVLEAANAPRAIVNAGGDVRAFGNQAFSIQLRHPENPGVAFTTVALRNAALATSAHYFAQRLVPGSQVGPIVDPRTGVKAARIVSASVRARNAMIADALTKVVMLAGEDALPTLQHFEADAIFIAVGGAAMCSPRWHAAFDPSS